VNEPGARGIEWAAVKFTEVQPDGSVYENPDAQADWDWLRAQKLGRVAYLYAHPAASVSATLAAFKAMLDELGLEDGDGIAVDLEVTDGLSPAEVASYARELFPGLAAAFGRRIILYTYVDFIRAGNCDGLEEYLLWIASITTPGIPVVPAPWKDWFAQQYYLGTLDQDVAHFSSVAAMQQAMGRPSYQTVVAVHVTGGEDSLVTLSHVLQTEISTMIRLTLNASANHMFSPEWADYLDYGNMQAIMPRGLPVRFYEHVRT
jgi:hypothetical protein